MLEAVLAIGSIGLIAGLGLAVASKIFYVYVDPKIVAVDEALPGANCGGCGYPGCSGAAVAIVKGEAPTNVCVGGGSDVHVRVAAILGVTVTEREPDIARPGCTYGIKKADLKYLYDGFNDCRAALLLNGGSKICPIGCLGLGTCVRACPFGALSMGEDNLPVVNPNLCTGCGTCERVCPKNIITLTSNSKRIQHEYTTEECSAPCQRSCPAGIDIPAYIREIGRGNYLEAVRIIKETNPFPSVCGRICVHPCEYECRRNLVDEPVAINALKRFAADQEMNSGQRVQIPQAPSTGKHVAVVGGGAEGLTAAYFLNRLGHEVSVYEASSQLGGLLRTGIPQHRLPTDVLNWEIDGILDVGVQAFTDHRLGETVGIDSLIRDGFDAVFVAIGGWDTHVSHPAREGSNPPLPGIRFLVDVVMDQRSGRSPSIGKNIMILGGGAAALEAASTFIREGARSVTIVSRTSREGFPALDEELRDVEERGVQLYFESGLIRMMGEGYALTHVELVRLSREGCGEGESALIPVDTLLIGAGRFPELIYAPKKAAADAEEDQSAEGSYWETVLPYPSPFAQQDIGIFRPGEAISDYKAVVEAIGSGRRAAASIQLFLTGNTVEAPHDMIRSHTQVLSLDRVEPLATAPRQKMHQRPSEELSSHPHAEVELGFSEDQAIQESARCLQCGLICYRRVEGDLH